MARSFFPALLPIATINSANAAAAPKLLPIIHSISCRLRPLQYCLFLKSSCSSAAATAASPIIMANVTRKNFKEALEQLKKQVQAADFVALDLEMTGVLSAPWRRNIELDTLNTRYYNLKDSAEKFQVLQCGVCPFQWDKAGNKYIAHPYNFYLFPRNERQFDGQARVFLCQTSSLEFLAKHQFDFNACIYDGISYLSREQEEAAKLHLGLSGESENLPTKRELNSEVPLTRTSDVIFSERIRIQVGQWKDNLAISEQRHDSRMQVGSAAKASLENSVMHEKSSDPMVDVENESGGSGRHPVKWPSLHIDVMGDHQVKLVQQVLYRHYKNLVVVPVNKNRENGHKQVRVMFADSEEEKSALLTELAEDSKTRLRAQLLEDVGFRQVIDVVANSGKPVVGHNCMLDFAHIYSKFFAPLPADASEFCRSLHRHFPCIVDTKYLMKAEPTLRGILANTSTTLSVIYSYICQVLPSKADNHNINVLQKAADYGTFQQVKLEVASEFQRYEGTSSKHEAGFDAYMTGAVFAQLCHFLKIDATSIRSLPEQVKLGEMGLASYTNLLYLGWVGQLVLDLTTGEEATGIKALRGRAMHRQNSYHENVVLIWGNDSLGTVQGLQKQLKDWFIDTAYRPDVNIVLLDKRSAFLVFTCEQFAEELVSTYTNSINSGTPQSSFAAKLIASGMRVARFERYERLCRSPLSTQTLAESAEALEGGTCMLRNDKVDSYTSAKEAVAVTPRGKWMKILGTDDGYNMQEEIPDAPREEGEVDDSKKVSKHHQARGLERACGTVVGRVGMLPENKRKASVSFGSNIKTVILNDASSPWEYGRSRLSYRSSVSKCNKTEAHVDYSHNSLSNGNHTKSRKRVRRRYRIDDMGAVGI
ncbi:hypothetical protein O6H91_03G065000 [Diphasiastrum complanatum]|uniref:Uncharacterized protein n=1 Tax=Diphasiastrum complanatum TaxID=34168 RepID=A0ACC2E751_DIPCM|nr:hypothetical protein O6H91_03G065000 [Diphasiastrum complanatum]